MFFSLLQNDKNLIGPLKVCLVKHEYPVADRDLFDGQNVKYLYSVWRL